MGRETLRTVQPDVAAAKEDTDSEISPSLRTNLLTTISVNVLVKRVSV